MNHTSTLLEFREVSQLPAGLSDPSFLNCCPFPCRLCASGVWWLVTSCVLTITSSPSSRDSIQSFTFLSSPCFKGAENEDSEKASSRVCWTLSGNEAWGSQCPSAKGTSSVWLLCVAIAWLFWRWPSTQGLLFFLVFREIYVKDDDEKVASEQHFIQNSNGRLFFQAKV